MAAIEGDLEATRFVLMIRGDDRAVRAICVLGEVAHAARAQPVAAHAPDACNLCCEETDQPGTANDIARTMSWMIVKRELADLRMAELAEAV